LARTPARTSAPRRATRSAPAARKTTARTRSKTTAPSGASKRAAKTKTPTAGKRSRATSGHGTTARAGAKPGTMRRAATAVRGTVAGAVAAVARRLPGGSRRPDAIMLLERDHRQLEKLLDRAEKTDARSLKQRTALLRAITTALDLHEAIEEQVLYPALKAHAEARAIVLEGYQEHHVADVIVAELHRMGKDDERWAAKLKVLKESIEHHIGEEEGEMFRTARAVMTRAELQRLGARMAAMKAERSTPSRS
jgi:hemerythrin-like domain-containing protein